jgi:hypothetical protein
MTDRDVDGILTISGSEGLAEAAESDESAVGAGGALTTVTDDDDDFVVAAS